MNRLHLDFESKSAVDIKKVGAIAYARHPSTDILCMAFSWNGEPVKLLAKGEIKPDQFAFGPEDRLIAHNAAFEFSIWNFIMAPRYGWPLLLDPSRWDCTLSRAAMCNLPLSLNNLGLALNITAKKDL